MRDVAVLVNEAGVFFGIAVYRIGAVEDSVLLRERLTADSTQAALFFPFLSL